MRRGAAVAVAATAFACMIPRSGAEVTLSPAEARARRAAVLLQAAELTDRMEDTQSQVVAAQLRQTRADDALWRARRMVRERAVNAYVHGTGAAMTALSAPPITPAIATGRTASAITRSSLPSVRSTSSSVFNCRVSPARRTTIRGPARLS